MENDYQKEIEELKARIEIEELKAKLSALERGETPKSKGSINFPSFDKDKIKGFFVSNKKLIIIISIITIFAVAILTTSICLIGIRGVYVNVDDPFESYVFTASAYEYRNDLDTEEPYLEKGTWKKKGNVISFTVKDELFGKLSSDYYLDVAKGNKSITIKEDNESEGDTFERVSVLGWSSVQNKKVEIKFDLNGGTSDTPIENQELKFLDKIDYKVPDPVRQDATFMGWYDKVDGFKDKENSNRYFTNKGVYKDVRYYANWFFHSDCPGHEYDSTCTCITCGKVEHGQDLNNDHKCDRCSEILTQCIDNNQDTLCDICGVITNFIPIGYEVGSRCPTYDLQNVYDSGKTNIESLRGKIVVINFWYTTCGPCLAELPYFNELANNYEDEVAVLIVHAAFDHDTTAPYLNENYPNTKMLAVFDEAVSGNNDYFYNKLGGKSTYPMTVILDENGIITHNVKKSISGYAELEGYVQNALGK